jgi:hypothetical protein
MPGHGVHQRSVVGEHVVESSNGDREPLDRGRRLSVDPVHIPVSVDRLSPVEHSDVVVASKELAAPRRSCLY